MVEEDAQLVGDEGNEHEDSQLVGDEGDEGAENEAPADLSGKHGRGMASEQLGSHSDLGDMSRQISDDSAKDSAKDEGSGDERAAKAAAMASLLSESSVAKAPRQDSDGSADELNQEVSYYDDSCSEHSEGPSAVPLLQRGRRTRRQLKQRVEGLVTELRKRREVFNRRQRNLAQSVNQRAQSVNQRLRHQWLAQQERLVLRSKQMTSKLQSGRSRAWRHKWIFALVQADFVASAFCLGAFPEKYYLYFTAQSCFMIGCKAFDYRINDQHYYLVDFCFFANFCILFWIWLFASSGYFFNAAEGACGLLAISVVAFRNSCVPHDFVRISHAYVHFPAVIFMISVKLKCEGDICLGMQAGYDRGWYRRFGDALIMYLTWAVLYCSVIFFIAKKRIDRKQRDTLYKYFAETLGFDDKLPKWARPYSKAVFMLGHMTLFLCGIWWIYLPFAFQAICTVIMLLAFFHNGGRYYVDYFWKTYERNTLLYVDAAYSAMSKDSSMPQKDGDRQEEPEPQECKGDEQ